MCRLWVVISVTLLITVGASNCYAVEQSAPRLYLDYYDDELETTTFEPETTIPTEEPTEPTKEPTEPTDEPTKPTSEPTNPTEEPTEPTEEPTEPTDTTEDPTEPTKEPTDKPNTTEPTTDEEEWEFEGKNFLYGALTGAGAAALLTVIVMILKYGVKGSERSRSFEMNTYLDNDVAV